ncbi:MAG TPA: hypothetical protein VG014_07620 [Acidimicrobiales bacterium]|jgi:hypothetical protein|nr:hypothetical protein [Acidimicrobiales bacterium]
MKLELRYEIHGTVAQFWELFFDPEMTRRLHLEALRSTSVEIEEQTGDIASGLERTMRYGQRPDAPGPVKRLFGSEVVTTEHGTFDPETGIWSFTLTPVTLGDKTDIRGSIEVKETEGTEKAAEDAIADTPSVRIVGETNGPSTEDGAAEDDPAAGDSAADEDASTPDDSQEGSHPDTCEQHFSLEAKVKIFGAGPVVERFIEKQARDTQNRAAAFFNRVLDGEE